MAVTKKAKMEAKTRKSGRGKKRRGKKSAATLWRRAVNAGLLLLAAGGFLFGIWKGAMQVGRMLYSRNPRFEIKHLIISCDGKLTEEYVQEIGGLHKGTNLWEYSFAEIEDRLLGVSYIESVYLERRLPDTLIVQVKERAPMAHICGRKVPQYPFTIDRHGYVLPPRLRPDLLPLIKGADMDLKPGRAVKHTDVATALEIVSICEDTDYLRDHVRIESLDLQYVDFIEMRLQGGIRVRMPRSSIRPKLRKLATLIKIAAGQSQRIGEVDLTLDSSSVPATTIPP